MANFVCSFCNSMMVVSRDTYRAYFLACETYYNISDITGEGRKNRIRFRFYKCPNCGKTTVLADRTGGDGDLSVSVFPQTICKHFPEYVPAAIRQDYEEACAIKSLSPKAAATLCRRCLQGMIHDFWGIHEKNLNAEITALKGKISQQLWEVVDAVRQLGNIGAHMEKDANLIVDIDPDEADKLVKLIERLIQAWYVERHTEQQLYSDIIGINQTAQDQRRP